MLKDGDVVQGIFYQASTGEYGFLEIEGEKEHLFIYGGNKNGALDQDIVEAKIGSFKGKLEAKVEKIVKRADRVFMGEFSRQENNKFGFVKLFNPSIRNDIFIPERFINLAKDKDIVAVKILKWEGKNPEGKIIEVLGDKKNPETIINGYILEFDFKLNFHRKVLNEVEKLEFNKKGIKNRKDKRNLFTFTIDGEDSKDLDDAISIEKKENGDYKLYVHIADVSHYVKPGSIIQEDAFLRGTSVYLPHKVLPMFPTKLSNDLCSLNPHTEKLTLTCEILLDNDGKVKKHTVYESIINSDYRLTYKEVQDMKDGKIKIKDALMFGGLVSEELMEKITIAYELKNKVRKNKQENGLLGFEFPETKIVVDENLQVKEFKEYPIYDSNNLIEEFMILANESVSRKFTKYPFLYRIHESPKNEDIERLQKILNIFGVHFDFVHYSTKEFSQLIEKVKQHKDRSILEKLILRTLQKAVYSDKNIGHFGLGLRFYSHFTSPIRRYPDFQIHRIIKMKLSGKLDGKMITVYKNKLEKIAKHCLEQEIKAQKLEWKVRDYFMTQYYKDKVGQEFTGIVSGMINGGFFVQFENTAEGFVPLVSREEKNSDWVADLDVLEFKNLKTKQKINVGQTVNVKLIDVDETKLRLEFELLDK